MNDSEKTKIIDDEHLRLLSVAHVIDGCLTIAFSCLFLLQFGFMVFAASRPGLFDGTGHHPNGSPPLEFFRIFAYIIGSFILLGIVYGVAKIFSAKFIKDRRHRIFSYIVAMPNLLLIPYGTLLGIVTLVVLGRKSVIDRYH